MNPQSWQDVQKYSFRCPPFISDEEPYSEMGELSHVSVFLDPKNGDTRGKG